MLSTVLLELGTWIWPGNVAVWMAGRHRQSRVSWAAPLSSLPAAWP